jgi:hypothetical protein
MNQQSGSSRLTTEQQEAVAWALVNEHGGSLGITFETAMEYVSRGHWDDHPIAARSPAARLWEVRGTVYYSHSFNLRVEAVSDLDARVRAMQTFDTDIGGLVPVNRGTLHQVSVKSVEISGDTAAPMDDAL